MSDSILDIESGLDKIETLVKTLHEERDAARAEAAALKRALDERETEYLQIDEELQEVRRTSEEQLEAARREREDLENRLAEVALKFKNILPLVMEYSDDADEEPDEPESDFESSYDET